MGMMKWNKMRGLEWEWKRVSVIEVDEKKHGMGMDGMNGQRTQMRMGMKSRDEW